MRASRLARQRLHRNVGAAVVVGIFTVAYGIGATPTSAVDREGRSGPAKDHLDQTLETALGESNRGVTDRVQVTRNQRRSVLKIRWAINGTPETTLSLVVANSEVRELLRAVVEHELRHRRVILKGTFGPPPTGTVETAVLRAVYVRPTLKTIRFKAPETTQGRTMLDLADELRLAVELGGRGIPSEPALTLDDSGPA